ncbi:MAG: pyrimidine 5'-nucleotidase [Mariprofundaceae bacterium]|nr:pyrimidine 5'-nucleotidase [Mariprofundaceae bacterium]
MPFDLAVIDLDNTLYAADSGVFARMDKRMTAFVARELNVTPAKASDLRVKYWKQYGTTLRGLMLHHGMEPEAFLHEVHDISVHEMLAPDTELNQALARLPGRKVIHTNGIREHAERVLAALDVAHHFTAIYDIRFNNYQPKPSAITLSALIESEGVAPHRTVIIDDMEDNLAAARSVGAQTALISTRKSGEAWDFHAKSLPCLTFTHKSFFSESLTGQHRSSSQ